MSFKYEDDSVKIWQSDARKMDMIQNESVDMIITSPPYNCSVKYDEWNDELEWEEYYQFVGEWVRESYRVLKVGGRIAINLPNLGNVKTAKSLGIHTYVDKYLPIMREAGFTIRECIFWVKGSGEAFSTNSTAWGSWFSPSSPYCRSTAEFILIAHKQSASLLHKGISDITRDEFLKWSHNVWIVQPETKRIHPAPFPEEIPYRLIRFYTYLSDVILDPFMGSGTVIRVAKNLHRKAFGLDISLKYCKLSALRARQEVLGMVV